MLIANTLNAMSAKTVVQNSWTLQGLAYGKPALLITLFEEIA